MTNRTIVRTSTTCISIRPSAGPSGEPQTGLVRRSPPAWRALRRLALPWLLLALHAAGASAATLAGGPMAAVTCKHLARALGGDYTPELRGSTAQLIAELRGSPEGQEGLGAFLEKRDPDWRR